MFFILDNLSSMLVFGTLVLVLAVTQLRVQQTTVEQTVVHIAKTQALDFADTVEREFKLMGVGIGNRNDMIADLQTDANGNTSAFTFRWEDDKTGKELDIGYRLVAKDTVEVGDKMVPLYQVERYEDGHLRGASPSTLTRWNVQLLDDTGNPSTLTDATVVRIAFANLMGIGDIGSYSIPETHWAITLRPHNLAL